MTARLLLILGRLLHYAYYVLGAAVIVVCLAALAFRLWLMPNIERYTPALEQAATQAFGYPVRIGHLTADWSGINPEVTLRDVRVIANANHELTVPRVELVASWLSLALFDLRLDRLLVEGANIELRRDKSGGLSLSGIPLNQSGGSSSLPDWLLRQPLILVKDVRVTWLDEKLDAPELHFDHVRILLKNHFGHHHFGAAALPSASAARRLDLRGELHGRSLRDWSAWDGSVYAYVDDARFENWRRWVPWAQETVKGGVGDVRFWVDIRKGQIVGTVGDANLRATSVSLQSDLPDLLFDRISGRVGWSRKGDDHSFFVKGLRFQNRQATLSEPASVRVDLNLDPAGRIRRVGASAGNLRLEAFTAVTGTLPLPRRAHDLIAALRPQGLVDSAEGHWTGAKDYAVRVSMREAGVQAYESLPGFSGITATVRADQDGGEVRINGSGSITLPRVFRASLALADLEARTVWHDEADGLHIDYDASRIANADLEGDSRGHLLLPAKAAPQVDIRAHLRHGEATAVYRYLPLAVNENAYQWLKRALVGGHSDDTLLVLKGPLDRFPFDKGGGQFSVNVRVRDGCLDYAPDWPRIEGVDGMLVFHDKTMTMTADSGHILAASIGPVRAFIPDLMTTSDVVVQVDGKASGETRTFLDFVRASPVDAHTGHFAADLHVAGNADLDLHLSLPTSHIEDTGVQGRIELRDNRLDAGAGLPELSGLNGRIEFNQDLVWGNGLRTAIFGQPASLGLSSQPGGRIKVRLAGHATADAYKASLPTWLPGRLHGGADWRADILMNPGRHPEVNIRSDLVGLAIGLPAPVGKSADQPLSLTISQKAGARNKSVVTARLGDIGSALMPVGETERMLGLHLGPGEAPTPAGPGLWVSGTLRKLDFDAWRGLEITADSEAGLPLKEVSLTLNELRLFNRRLHDSHFFLHPNDAGWNLAVNGRELVGELTTAMQADGWHVLGNFKALRVPDAEAASAPAGTAVVDPFSDLASLELNAASFGWQGHDLGELHLRLDAGAEAFRVERLSLANADGHIDVSGLISRNPRRRTQLKFETESDNLGKILARVGQANVIKGGRMKMAGSFGWMGGPGDFAVVALDGDLHMDLRNGQFLKLDPGAAKLIGIFSLQSLPRRISLDFRDVFSQGFAFDEINGGLHVERGVAYFRDLRMNGPAAKIRMSGMADMVHETQHLRVNVLPRIEDSAALAAALLGGPVVGIGTFIANKVLKNPIGQVLSFDYEVSGPWSDPQVVKLKPPEPQDATVSP